MSAPKLRNIGPKSAAWLRQVGLRSEQDLSAIGPVAAFMKVRRAGFKPSLNLLYSLEGALVGCHWQEIPEARRQQLVAEYEVAVGALPTTRAGQQAGPVHETHMQAEADEEEASEIRFED
ncbi:MAG: transcriptional regulator [Stenotrophomonas sp.]|jgi:DNA transformation protein|nr:MAG: transcriptional regulator [Stenotrophomonas sp.]